MSALALADWARTAEDLLQSSLAHPGPLTVALVFAGGLLTSLGPCSLSLLPVTLAYLAGFDDQQERPWQRSLSFCGGIVAALVLLGLASGALGRIYGQVPGLLPTLVALLAVLMGLSVWYLPDVIHVSFVMPFLLVPGAALLSRLRPSPRTRP